MCFLFTFFSLIFRSTQKRRFSSSQTAHLHPYYTYTIRYYVLCTITVTVLFFSAGYRIVKNKKLFVGTQAPVGQAVSAAKYSPAIAGTAVSSSSYRSAASTSVRPVAVVPVTQSPLPRESSWRGSPFIYPSDSQSSPLRFPSSGVSASSPAPPRSAGSHYQRPSPLASSSTATTPSAVVAAAADYYAVRPIEVNSIATADDGQEPQPYRRRSSSARPLTAVTTEPERPLYEQPLRPHTFRPAYRKVQVDTAAQRSESESEYDGVSFVRNGFKYYLPRHYHEEQSDDTGDTRAGSFGYVDPFGIRRVVYYNTAPGTGFVHRKNNRYVGLNAEPYDPRPDQ